MVRVYRPTGGKPGRPSEATKLIAQLGESKSRTIKTLRKRLIESEKVPAPLIALGDAAVKEIAAGLGHSTNYRALEAPLELAGETPTEVTDSAVSEMLRRMHYLMPGAMARALENEPEAFVKTYLDLIQYKLAKLSKSEVSGSMQHAMGVFVPVEMRDVPIQLVKGEDGVHSVPPPKA